MVDTLTPMFRQYQSVKRQYPDVLLLFRMGDFYELFFEDAEVAARELELTLTSREAGKGKRVPMCGVPYHAVQRYLARLIKKGYRAAICDQTEDPKYAKGLVRREVTRVVTPGTALEDEILDGGSNNYLVAVAREGERLGLAVADVSTGEFRLTEIEADEGREPLAGLTDELARLQPAECLLPDGLYDDEATAAAVRGACSARVTRCEREEFARQSPEEVLKGHFGVASLHGFGCAEMPAGIAAAADVVRYLRANHLDALPHLTSLSVYSTDEFMVLDAPTRRNLELTRAIRTGGREGTVLSLVDRTVTPMGARLCRQWLLQPLLDVAQIERRLGAVEAFVSDQALSQTVAEELKGVYDLERLISRTAAGTANARDLRALAASLRRLPAIAEALATAQAPLLQELTASLDTLQDVADLIESTIVEDPPASLQEGGLIRRGHSADLDELRGLSGAGKEWIARLEATERERTGIKSLKVGYNQVFGYYIEVSKPNLSLVPDDYIRKQTLTNAERFITPDLKEQEAKVLGAEEKIVALEYELFCGIREQVGQQAPRVLQTARAIAQVDVLRGFAAVAVDYGYLRPTLNDGDEVRIVQGRHPVVERALTDQLFVPNDCALDCAAARMLIVTGPNMAGKSTYLRQVALIVLLAQMGSFVPARSADIGVVDRIFTRVGAMDDLASGQSTFMVEMTETANILHNASGKSLIILDEIGRGTSTFDGLSIAWAVAEFICRRIGAKTLFATHYHHLNELAEIIPGVRNVRVAVKEEGDQVTFLHRIVEGGTDRSYGVQVARLAGLPREVIERALEVLYSLESESTAVAPKPEAARGIGPPVQLQLFEAAPDPLIEALRKLDLDTMTPLEALQWLSRARDDVERRKG